MAPVGRASAAADSNERACGAHPGPLSKPDRCASRIQWVSGLLIAFVVAALVTLLLVRSASLHAAHTSDRDFSKPQKVHTTPVPRIGGLAIALGLLAWLGWHAWQGGHLELPALLLACAMPAFLAGFVQDCTEAVTPRGRLIATAVSAMRFEKPHSLSYQVRMRTMVPSITLVWSMWKTELCGSWLMSIETSGSSV